MKKILIILMSSLLLCGCSSTSSKKDLKTLMKEKEYIIVDVRTKEEYEASHLVGAINIPVDEIDNSIDLDKEKNIFVYCQSGTRSAIAFQELTNLDYTVYDLGSFASIDLPKE